VLFWCQRCLNFFCWRFWCFISGSCWKTQFLSAVLCYKITKLVFHKCIKIILLSMFTFKWSKFNNLREVSA
jgi:hypothetical protein